MVEWLAEPKAVHWVVQSVALKAMNLAGKKVAKMAVWRVAPSVVSLVETKAAMSAVHSVG
jgi:hypothetical protein